MLLLRKLLRALVHCHRDQRGAVSLETILILGAIALPILVFVIKFGWPKVWVFFNGNINELQAHSNKLTAGE